MSVSSVRHGSNILLRRHLMVAERGYLGHKSSASVDSRALRKGNVMLRLCANGVWSTELSFNKNTILHRRRVDSRTVPRENVAPNPYLSDLD